MTAPLIGMIGRRRSGKDSFASTLVDELGYDRVAFADPLREAALALNPLVGPAPLPGDLTSGYRRLAEVVETLGWERAKDTVPEVRVVLQRLGTNAVRALDDTFWVRAAVARIEASSAPVVVTDCRFPNEAEAVRLAGGYLVRVVRPGATTADDVDLHASETALDDYPEDFYVDNSGTLADLAATARDLISHIP